MDLHGSFPGSLTPSPLLSKLLLLLFRYFYLNLPFSVQLALPSLLLWLPPLPQTLLDQESVGSSHYKSQSLLHLQVFVMGLSNLISTGDDLLQLDVGAAA